MPAVLTPKVNDDSELSKYIDLQVIMMFDHHVIITDFHAYPLILSAEKSSAVVVNHHAAHFAIDGFLCAM